MLIYNYRKDKDKSLKLVRKNSTPVEHFFVTDN